MSELNKNGRYAIYCAGGYRSMIATSLLKRNGFEHILNIDGGINNVKTMNPELVEVT